ncbi:DivIVA domain-containing protein [Nakamurella flavida]|uniref:DivIVA domain-containing protein n=1 Tax=Nakamurella flavida TaxID=363630 RepID=A0A938YL09_9ACTN|nr:DivIVA domain-containing protein [Nakamurella flavida]MBM9474968.1 DivIVA domain-containing protein [Nakamurella flavida]MDP9776537.1 DivIVA domain-containing protein [Nakamurella flavida]
MTTLLQYLLFAAVIGLIVFAIAVLVFGRGEQLAPLPPRTSPAQLPEAGITAENVERVRFALALRGYRMSDVDWTLHRLGTEVDRLRAALTDLGGDPDRVAETDDVGPGDAQTGERHTPPGADQPSVTSAGVSSS